MLLFLLIYFSHYDVFNCKGTNAAKFNESLLLDKLYQNLLHVNTILNEMEQKTLNTSVLKGENGKHGKRLDKEIDYVTIRDLDMIKTPKKNWNSKHQKNLSSKLHLSPQYKERPIQPTISDRRQGFSHRFPPPLRSNIRPPLLVVRRPPAGYRMAIVPIKPRPRLARPGFLIRPMHSGVDPRLLSDYQFQNVYLRPPGSYHPKHLYLPRPASEKFNQSSLEAELKKFHEALPKIFEPFHFPLSPPFPDPAELWISQAVTTSSSYIRPTNDKGEKIWLTGVYNLYVPTHSSEMTVVNTTPYTSVTSTESTTSMTKINDYEPVTTPENIGELFAEDEHGYLYVTAPQKGGTPGPAPLYSTNVEPTFAGNLSYEKIKVQLHHPSSEPQLPTQRYLELVVRLDEGYMVVFMLELCRLIAVKNKKDVRQALFHAETIYNHLYNNGELAWIEEPLQTVIWKMVILTSEGDIEIVQTYASMMFHMLLRRKQTLSPEVNGILDKADLFYNDAEGEELFKALMEFENYPNTTKSSYGLCESLFKSFLHPFRRGRHYRTLRRKKLLDSINNALKTRFPRVLTELTEANPQGVFQKKKKKNRRPFPYKLMRKRKKYRIHNENVHYGRQHLPNIDYVNSILRSMSPTKEQVTFRAMPSKSFRIKTTPRTARAYSFNKRNRKLTHILKPLQEFDYNFGRYSDRSSENTGRHHSIQKISETGHRPPLRVTTPTTGSVLLKSSYFGKNNHINSKNTDHHHLFRQTSAAKHRAHLRVTASSTTSKFLRYSNIVHLKRPRKDKMHYHHLKETSEKSKSQEKNDKEKIRAELLRKISAFPTMF